MHYPKERSVLFVKAITLYTFILDW